MTDFRAAAEKLVQQIIENKEEAVRAIEGALEDAYSEGHSAGSASADDELEVAEEKLEEAREEVRDVASEVFDACIAAAEGVPGAAKWAADKINAGGVFDAGRARLLASRRPRDFYVHG